MKLKVQGKGDKLVLLIHGFLEDNSMWESFSLSEWQTVLVELPGHGSESLIPYQTIEELALPIKSEVEHHELKLNAIIGHSMGGYVALELFKHLPEIDALVLLNSNFWSDSDQKKIDRKRVAELVFHQKKLFLETAIPNLFAHTDGNEEFILNLIESANRMSPESIAMASLAMSIRKDNTDFLKSESRPVLLIQGDRDKLVPLEIMKEKTSDWTEFVALPSGHMSMIECPELTNQVIELFLNFSD